MSACVVGPEGTRGSASYVYSDLRSQLAEDTDGGAVVLRVWSSSCVQLGSPAGFTARRDWCLVLLAPENSRWNPTYWNRLQRIADPCYVFT
ncbi:hypothetical protein GN956_G17236 [Arapaima gigas]